MATLRPDNMSMEYSFTPAETMLAKSFDPLKVMWLQTMYAQILKAKSTEQVPESSLDDRLYLLQMGKYEGQLMLIQALLDGAVEASKATIEVNSSTNEIPGTMEEIKSLSDRASSQVHQQ